jgi:pimeloyl-ACP methyl ester carboxylesterase
MNVKPAAIQVRPDLTLYHTGPALDHGPLPSIFYFALSGPDSLCLDPFNQPVQFLLGRSVRVFSLTLPGHENGLPASKAMQVWADDFAKGLDPLAAFLDDCFEAVAFTIAEKFADPEQLGVMGLSRGGLVALHAAARNPDLRHILCFAPVTDLRSLKEFGPLQENRAVQSYRAETLKNVLQDKHIRIYIGNHDTRVDTRLSFEFAMSVVESAETIRTPQVELFITASMGKDGHGTSPEIFAQGAEWIHGLFHSRRRT